MSQLPKHVEENIRTRGLLRPSQGVVVAVSGGLDSMVLLRVLHGLAPKYRWKLVVAHLNHQLRGRSSDADERLVRQTAKRLKLPVTVKRAEVRRFAREQKISIEMAARAVRHGFLAGAARRRGAKVVALGQHADDQVELFFLRLLRGSGGEGLAGMKWRSPSPADAAIEVVRPLLNQPKTALQEYAYEQGIRHREDASNARLDFQRNRVRHELLPLLRRKYQPALHRTLGRVMEIVGAEAEFVTETAASWLEGVRSPKAGIRGLKEDQRGARLAFEALPVAVQRRCVQLQLLGLGVEPDYETVEQLRRSARPVTLSPNRAAVRDAAGRVRLQEEPGLERFRTQAAEMEMKGRAGEMEFGGAKIQWRIGAAAPAAKPCARTGQEWFDADKVGSVVQLRHWRPGDRFHPIGMAQPVKLQDFFSNQKVPRDRRRRLVVAATRRGEVFWVEGMRISERFKLTPGTIRSLQWRWKRV